MPAPADPTPADPAPADTNPAADTASAPASPAQDTVADPDAGWNLLPPPPRDFGSALDPLSAAPRPSPADDTAVPTDGATSGTTEEAPLHPEAPLVRDRWGVRPKLTLTGLPGGPTGLALGGSFSHQWWVLSAAPVRGAGETKLDLAGRVGGLSGPDLRLVSAHGLWLGPVGLFAGPALRLERLETDRPALPLGLTVGPQLRIAAELGPFLPWAAATPSWLVAGRGGDFELEKTLDLGLDIDVGPVDLRLSGALRDTAAGAATTGVTEKPSTGDVAGPTIWEAGVGLAFSL